MEWPTIVGKCACCTENVLFTQFYKLISIVYSLININCIAKMTTDSISHAFDQLTNGLMW